MSDVDGSGFIVVPAVCTPGECDALIAELDGSVLQTGMRGGARLELTDAPAQLVTISRSVLMRIAARQLGEPCFPVRAVYFDKTADANWKVAWHQDVTIAVARRSNIVGFGPWTVKNGVVHVQPPVAVLDRMVTVRLHLDECMITNGPLRVIPGSHKAGRLSSAEIAAWRTCGPEVACTARRGDAVIMRPLLLHASSPAEAAQHRRVLHVEYASDPLPEQLDWFERCA